MKLMSLFALLFVVSGHAFADHHEPDEQVAASMTQVKAVVDLYMEAFERGDSALFASLMAQDEEMITFGTDAAERWVGTRNLIASFEKQVNAFDVDSVDISNQVIRLSRSNSVAWFSELADWNIRIRDETDRIEGIRITGVLERQAGGWKIVQFHTSAPVAGQIIEY